MQIDFLKKSVNEMRRILQKKSNFKAFRHFRFPLQVIKNAFEDGSTWLLKSSTLKNHIVILFSGLSTADREL